MAGAHPDHATWSVFCSFKRAIEEDFNLSLDNPMFCELDQPDIGHYRVLVSPLAFSAAGRVAAAPVSGLGKHTEGILVDVAGLPGGEIAKPFDDGIARGEAPTS